METKGNAIFLTRRIIEVDFYEKILSLKTFLVSNIIIFCFWYENFFSNIFFFHSDHLYSRI